ncbi:MULTISPECIES: DUF2513 domain-containing protein [unclassified Lactobacillus]|uniref:DUF2513 domain-containing protein n=1 Tax=unclassified Lactobacillus TaxID=2620435 RepID=UPI00226A15E3|nr:MULTISPECIES: DUF2513 domain-containing protein [unclassified Lactobacillus]MCX8721390.1 DUF2513 domain-containing protein [Lactobacillus sp. B4010]MCX8732393.1 DUF2513 domain-containing protein [Lactobacillus sp. B4015]MCX8734413.1 DUF2513 domain-containing protein [Lactobacillus sp. B4012]
MELNYDFVREILIDYAESKNVSGPTVIELLDFAKTKNKTYDELAFSLARMYEGNLISDSPILIGNHYKIVSPGNLTWQGNEYLSSIRSQNIWSETKSKIKKIGSKVTFETIVSVASAIAKHQLGLS